MRKKISFPIGDAGDTHSLNKKKKKGKISGKYLNRSATCSKKKEGIGREGMIPAFSTTGTSVLAVRIVLRKAERRNRESGRGNFGTVPKDRGDLLKVKGERIGF